jgi:hypothetical protein
MAHERKISAVAAVVLMLPGLSLGETATATAGSSLPDAIAQATPQKPSIFDPPPQRDQPAMTPEERLKLQKDLTAARDRHPPDAKTKTKSKTHPAPAPSAKPAR